MRNNFNTATVLTTLALALPGCGGNESAPTEHDKQPARAELVLDGAPIPDAQITAADCPYDFEVSYPDSPKDNTAKAERKFRRGLHLAHFQQVERSALNNNLPQAEAIARSLIREDAADPSAKYTAAIYESFLYYPKNFLANPEQAQLALKAECAASAGEISTAESLLKRSKVVEFVMGTEDQVESSEGSHAEQVAERNADFITAYALLDLIDNKGATTRAGEQDEVEYWVGEKASDMAQQSPDGAKKALELVDSRVDDKGQQTRASVRDEVEYWVQDQAEDLAGDGQNAKALELASLVDDKGQYTQTNVQRAVDDIITG